MGSSKRKANRLNKQTSVRAMGQGFAATSSNLPLVSICTVTYNRSRFLPLLEDCILRQSYPRDLIEWILLDDSDDGLPAFQPRANTGLTIRSARPPQRLPLGAKRNLSHSLCRGDIIVYMDDDDYYPPSRVAHAVEALTSSEKLVAGSSVLPIMFVPERELWIAGPYGPNHATANTFAFKKELLGITKYNEDARIAEEKEFLKRYSIPMVQLDPFKTIVCIGHSINTFDKRNLIQGGKNPRLKQSALQLEDPTTKAVIEKYEALALAHKNSPAPLETFPKTQISVILSPKYPETSPELLKRAIQSIEKQSVFHGPDQRYSIEIVLTAELAAMHAGSLPESTHPIRVLSRATDSGIASINQALRESTGEFATFLTDHDQWHTKFLQTGFQALKTALPDQDNRLAGDQHTQRLAALVTSTVMDIDENKKILRINDFGNTSGWIVPRSILETTGGFKPQFSYHIEHEWLGRFAQLNQKRMHLVEATAPIHAEFTAQVRPWLNNIITSSNQTAMLYRHEELTPLVLSTMRRECPTLAFIEHHRRTGMDSQTAIREEVSNLITTYGAVPW